jgi:hypothetical protein
VQLKVESTQWARQLLGHLRQTILKSVAKSNLVAASMKVNRFVQKYVQVTLILDAYL